MRLRYINWGAKERQQPIFSHSCTVAWDILLLRQPVERFATASSSILDLFFLGAISVSRVQAQGLREGLVDATNNWKVQIWIWWWLGVKRIKTLEVTARVYMVSYGNIVNTWKFNGWFTFLWGFYHIFRHEFLILKSKLRDLNLRLGGYGICVLEIYFSIFLENNEGKRLKWPSAWFYDST